MMPSNHNAIFRQPSVPPTRHNRHSSDKMKLVMEAASFTESREKFAKPVNPVNKSVSFGYTPTPGNGMLLAMPEDKVSLSEVLCVVREASYSAE